MPNHPLAQQLLAACGVPLAAPSANRSGKISPTEAAHVAQELGDKVSFILDGGPCRVGVESTVVDISGPQPVLLRHGGITPKQLAEAGLHGLGTAQAGHALHSPGMLASHYAPGKPLRLNAQSAEKHEALLGFGHAPHATLNLSPSADVQEAAANLFRMLRALDAMTQYAGIAVMPIVHEGLGLAINDRLARAACRE
jgi:L-threonylcarbamoyladenylate synthase